MGREAGRIGPRQARGCRCFAVCGGDESGEIRAYGWLTQGPEWIGEIGLEIRPGPGDAYIWNCVTLEPHRRTGMFRAIVRHITEVAKSEGKERLWIASVAGTAERAIAELGYIPVVRASVTVVGPLRWLHLSGDSPPVLSGGRAGLGRHLTRVH